MKLSIANASFLAWSASTIALTTFPCSITVEDLDYDLCPLLHDKTLWNISAGTETPPTFTTFNYAFSMGGSLPKDGTLPAHLQCPAGTWICLTVENTRPNHPSEPPRIVQVVPVAGGPDIRPTAKRGSFTEPSETVLPLSVHLHGGSWANRTQKALIQFHCDHGAQEPSEPRYSWSWNGTHAFSWTSRHACPRNLPGAPPSRPGSDSSDGPPRDSESNTDSELKDKNHKSTSLFLLVSVFVIVCLLLIHFTYLYLSRFRSHSRLVSIPGLRSSHYTGFRPSAVRLLRWAQQAGFDDEDSELDYMINSKHLPYDRDLDEAEGNGEEIPLTPSPRHGRKWNKGDASPGVYGSFAT